MSDFTTRPLHEQDWQDALILHRRVYGETGFDRLRHAPAFQYDDDELVEITPKSIRLRKRYLTESERKRAGR